MWTVEGNIETDFQEVWNKMWINTFTALGIITQTQNSLIFYITAMLLQKIYDVIEIIHSDKKERNLTKSKIFFVHRDTEKGNHLNDKILSHILKFLK
jgi:hypothetical protein